jgi:hypothetical protein
MIEAIAAVHAGMCRFDREPGFTVSDMQQQPSGPEAAPPDDDPRHARGHIVALLRDLVHNCAATDRDIESTREVRQHGVNSLLRQAADRIWSEAFVAGVAWQRVRTPTVVQLDVTKLSEAECANLISLAKASADRLRTRR